jgi:hypothetical protein
VESRRFLNDAQPRPLFLAQFALYAWAVFAVLQSIFTGFSALVLLFSLVRVLAAWGLSEEGRWAYWLSLIVSALSLVPVLNDVVHRPGLLLHPDFLVLLAFPIIVISLLTHPASRDFERVWFS